MIIRMNDNDWKQVIATIAARTGVPVEQLSGNQ
jgi:hypothetical protein